MANAKISELTALSIPVSGDLFPIVDVSDTTMGASGTTKKITFANLEANLTVTNMLGLGTGVATFLANPSSANLASAVTGETGSGALVFGTSPTFTTSITTPSVLASANDSGALGASGTAFADLFLASGGVINWNAGNATITHSTGLLTSNVDIAVPDEAYDATNWNGSLEVPTKNALRDKIESMGGNPTSAVRAYLTTSAQTVPTGFASRATVQFNAESFDVDGEYNTGTYTFTPAATGKYIINVHIGWNNWTADVACELYLVIGGVENLVKKVEHGNNTSWTIDYSDLVELTASTSTVQVVVAQYTGSDRNINTGEYKTNLSIKRVS